jgi:glycerol-3-phosphate cytidylyltransferase
MTRVGYAPGCFDLFHIGHLNLLRRAKEECDFLIAGVVSDEILTTHKGITPVVPLAERLEIVRNVHYVDAAFPAMTADKLEIWRTLRFDVLLKGDDWRGTAKGEQLERDFETVGVEVVYLPYTTSTSSTALRAKLRAVGSPAGNDLRTMRTADCSSAAAVWDNMVNGSSRSISPVWPMGD